MTKSVSAPATDDPLPWVMIADAGVDRLLRLDQAFLRIGLVVERNDLDLLAENAALGVQLVGEKLEGLQADFADAGAAARQRIDIADFDRLLRHRRTAEHRQRKAAAIMSLRMSFLPELAWARTCRASRLPALLGQLISGLSLFLPGL